MRIAAKYQQDGGWKCILRDSGGEECRTSIMAYQDMDTHLRLDHGIKETYVIEDTRDIEDVSDLLGDILKSGGA